MANPWFRMYSEFATDQKVQMLSEVDQRRLVMLFCFRCNGNVTLQDEEVTFLLRVTHEEWQQTKQRFIRRGFIDENNNVLNWDKRQFQSDTSKNRVAAYRERKKQGGNGNVTLQKRKCNAIDTDTDTDTDNKKPINEDFERFYSAYPKKKSRIDAEKAWKKVKPPIEYVLKALEWQKLSAQWIKNKGEYIPYPASYINSGGWMNEPVISTHARKGKMDISGIDYKAGVNEDGSF